MISSMTGFAAQQLELPSGVLNVEIRAVNHRYFDLQLRLPEELRASEAALREVCTKKIKRGKVDCRILLSLHNDTIEKTTLDIAGLKKLAHLSATVQTHFSSAQPLTIAEIIHWPGVLIHLPASLTELPAQAVQLLTQTLAELIKTRQREGQDIVLFLCTRLDKIHSLLNSIRPHLSEAIAQYEAKITARFLNLFATEDNDRIRQEMVLLMQRVDVEEELNRLESHSHEVRRILGSNEVAVGKRLDFSMQELNREANTLGSKSMSITISQAAIELKVLIEQMREQIQNIE